MTPSSWLRLVAIVITIVLCGACSSTRFTAAPRSPAVMLEHGLHAGIARADITPPPGLGLFGHGPEGRVATGFRLRLYCRPIVLADEADVIALVPCDLAAISIELHRAVAAKLIAHNVPIGGDRLFLSATHTHAGPAHYFGARSYSGAFASREYGFDEAVLEWLAERIADGVDSAYRRRQPACAGWGFTEVFGLSRNRSYEAFAANTTLPSALDPALHFGQVPKEITPGQLAVDPILSVLRIDARSAMTTNACERGRPLGAFAVFGMHPTAIANTSDVYHGDVFGFATRHAESLIEDGSSSDDGAGAGAVYPSPSTSIIVGLANGIEGDVSPAWDRQSPVEARRIGVALGRRIHNVFDSIVTQANVERLRHAYRDLSFPNAQASYDPSERLCPTPEIGVSAAGGAEDGPTRFRALREFNEGVRLQRPRECHGVRLPLTGPDGPPKADGLELPAWAPIGVARIAGELIAFVPVELTTVAGIRIRERLMITSGASKTTPIVGLTNAYMQYVTTSDEYPLQHYEGASNLYGPYTATFLENQIAYLGRVINDVTAVPSPPQMTAINEVRPIPYDPQRARIAHIPPTEFDADDSIELEDLPVENLVAEGQPAFRIAWRGTPPNAMAYRMRLSVRVIDEVGRMIDDDRGANIEVRSYAMSSAAGPLEKNNTWSAVWTPPVLQRSHCPDEYVRERNVRFEIVGPVPRRSKLFAISCRATDERKLVR